MNIFEDVVITKIYNPTTVFSEKGRRYATEKRQCFALSFCESGQITYTQKGKDYISHPYTAILLPKNATYRLYGDAEGLFQVINFECENLNVEDITVLPIRDPARYMKDFYVLSGCFLHENMKLRQFQILYSILEALASEQTDNPLSSILRYIETHVSNPNLTNRFLAEKMGISEVYLRKLFVSYLNVTPRQYVLELRIKTAQQLLVSTAKSVTEISEECGFASVYHFCRIFKQKTAMTPTEYISKHRTYKI